MMDFVHVPRKGLELLFDFSAKKSIIGIRPSFPIALSILGAPKNEASVDDMAVAKVPAITNHKIHAICSNACTSPCNIFCGYTEASMRAIAK